MAVTNTWLVVVFELAFFVFGTIHGRRNAMAKKDEEDAELEELALWLYGIYEETQLS